MRRMSFLVGIILFFLLISSWDPISIEAPAYAIGDADVDIQLNQTRVLLDTLPGRSVTITYDGVVRVDVPWVPEVQSLIVNIVGEVEDWTVSIPPPLVFTKGVDELPFVIEVDVPPDISGVFRFNVTGNWSYDPGIRNGECNGAEALIYVNEKPSITLGCEEPYKDVAREDSVSFEVIIINDGEVDAFVDLSITNLVDLANEEMVIQMSQSRFQIPPGGNSNVSIMITTSSRTQLDTYPIELYAETTDPVTEEGTGIFVEYTLYLEVVIYDPDPEPPANDDDDDEPLDDDEEPVDDDNETVDDDDEEPIDDDDNETADDDDLEAGVVTNDPGIPTPLVIGIPISIFVILVIIVVFYFMNKKRKKVLS